MAPVLPCYRAMQVALTALDFWSDTYIVTLQGLPADARKGAMVGHTPLLQHLCAALVMRARLEPDVALTATADARDLPEHVRMVRLTSDCVLACQGLDAPGSLCCV